MDNWRTIDTAPKDGTRVLVYDPLQGVGVGRWYDEAIEDQDRLPEDFNHETRVACWTFDGLTARPPTHWQPLPAPPEADK